VRVRFCDETAFGFGWIAAEPAFLQRASHALRAGDGVWLVDPVDGEGVEARIRALGEPRGVIQLLDRHPRDCAALAARLGVPLHEVPAEVPGSLFELTRVVDRRTWRESVLWWPEERVLVCADALGTAPYFLAGGERLGVHPFLRLRPPRALRDTLLQRCLAPRHVLCGHGEGIHGDEAAFAPARAVSTARRRIPRYVVSQLRRRR
jgi:glyoxylase-like metal-dependent hydrolase (beta-lactamase superfamily II)